jgi:hypothetical protein
MRPECKIALEHFTDALFDAIDSQLRDRDHWDVGGVAYGDRLMVLTALKSAIAETAPKPVVPVLLDRGITGEPPNEAA